VAIYVDSTNWARDVNAVTSDSITANAGAVVFCREEVRVGKPYESVSPTNLEELEGRKTLRTYFSGSTHVAYSIPSHSVASHPVGSACCPKSTISTSVSSIAAVRAHTAVRRHSVRWRSITRLISRRLDRSVTYTIRSDSVPSIAVPVVDNVPSANPAGLSGILGAVVVLLVEATAVSNADGAEFDGPASA